MSVIELWDVLPWVQACMAPYIVAKVDSKSLSQSLRLSNLRNCWKARQACLFYLLLQILSNFIFHTLTYLLSCSHSPVAMFLRGRKLPEGQPKTPKVFYRPEPHPSFCQSWLWAWERVQESSAIDRELEVGWSKRVWDWNLQRGTGESPSGGLRLWSWRTQSASNMLLTAV